MKQGDIIIINFPFTSFESSKIKPALIISNEKFNKGKNVLLLAISTQKGPPIYSIPLKNGDLSSGKLKKSSYIRFHNILSIEKKLILKKVAQLKKEKIKETTKKLNSFIS